MDIVKSLFDEDFLLVNSWDSDLYIFLYRVCYNGYIDMVKVYVLNFNY